MANNGAPPYLIPRLDTIRFGSWLIADLDWSPLPSVLDAWDSETSLSISQNVEVDIDGLMSDTRVPLGTSFVLSATWTSSTSGMKMPIAVVEIGPTGKCVLEGVLSGDQIGGTLDIETTLSLARTPATAEPGIVADVGAVLARSSVRLVVESAGAKFPIAVVDFANTKIDSDASWRLDVTGDLWAPFLGEFQLLVNSRDKDLVRAIESRSPSAVDGALVAELEGQVAALMFEIALSNRSALEENSEWPEGSVGDILMGLVESAETYGIRASSLEPSDRAAFVARIAGLVRSRGQGRLFT